MAELHLGVNYNGQAQNLIYTPGTAVFFYGTYTPNAKINIYLDGIVRTHILQVQVDGTGYFEGSATLPVTVGQTYKIRACTAGSLGIYECALFPDQSIETISLIVQALPTPTPTPTPSECPRGAKYLASNWDLITGCDRGYARPQLSDYCECQNTVINPPPKDKTDWGTMILLGVVALGAAYVLGGKRR